MNFLGLQKRNKLFNPHTSYIGGYPLPEVSFIKYLGVTIDKQLTWNEHIKKPVKQDLLKAFYSVIYHLAQSKSNLTAIKV